MNDGGNKLNLICGLLGWFDDCIQISFALMKLNESKQIKPTNNKQTKNVR